MPQITDNVGYDIIAREWRLKWSDDEEKLSLTQVQEVVDSLKSDLGKIAGLESVQRVVCGCQKDYKLIIAVKQSQFEKWEKAQFAPEAIFVDAAKRIAGVSQVETQTYTLRTLSIRKPVERRRDPTDLLRTKTYTESEFKRFYGPELGAKHWRDAASIEERLERQIATAPNRAFVFIKPHANTPEVRELVKTTLEAKGVTIHKSGTVKSEIIDKKKLIDQHYYAIASKATMVAPKDLPVPSDKFKEKFGLSWEDALKQGNVYNAKEACAKLGVDGDGLDALWGAAKKKDKLVKLGGGFYAGLVEAEGKEPLYTFNAFFMSMRDKFTKPGESIFYFDVTFSSKDLSWKQFRGELLGPTNPEEAPAESLRGLVFKSWEKLGLKAKPDTGDNAVHASASPFEGLAERMNWLGTPVEKDTFGVLALKNGLTASVLKQWSVDPQVNVNAEGKKGSLFDTLEDSDAAPCLGKLLELFSLNRPAPRPAPEKKEKQEKQDARPRLVKE